MAKSILSVLALAGNKDAAVSVAAADLHSALFHLCHAGQATPLQETFEALPNRGKASKIRAVVSDYWQAAASHRAKVKADGKLDKSGRFVGLQADNIPFALGDIIADLGEAVAVVKKAALTDEAKAEAEAKKAEAKAEAEAKANSPEAEAEKATAMDEAQASLLAMAEVNTQLKEENEALKAENDRLTVLVAMLEAGAAKPAKTRKAVAVAA